MLKYQCENCEAVVSDNEFDLNDDDETVCPECDDIGSLICLGGYPS